MIPCKLDTVSAKEILGVHHVFLSCALRLFIGVCGPLGKALVWPWQPSGTVKKNMVQPESFIFTNSVINL